MKNILCLLAIVVALVMATSCGKSLTYNSEKMPDSIIIQAFEETGVNPEVFADKTLKAVKAEIMYGVITQEQALDKALEFKRKVTGGVLYNDIVAVVDAYEVEYISKSEGISKAALVAAYILLPDMPSLNLPYPIGDQDRIVVGDFLDHIIKGLSSGVVPVLSSKIKLD